MVAKVQVIILLAKYRPRVTASTHSGHSIYGRLGRARTSAMSLLPEPCWHTLNHN
jgi:hypothetical protein